MYLYSTVGFDVCMHSTVGFDVCMHLKNWILFVPVEICFHAIRCESVARMLVVHRYLFNFLLLEIWVASLSVQQTVLKTLWIQIVRNI